VLSTNVNKYYKEYEFRWENTMHEMMKYSLNAMQVTSDKSFCNTSLLMNA